MNKPTLLIYFKNPKLDEKGTCFTDDLTFQNGEKMGEIVAGLKISTKLSNTEIKALKNENLELRKQVKVSLETIKSLNKSVSELSAELTKLKEDLRK